MLNLLRKYYKKINRGKRAQVLDFKLLSISKKLETKHLQCCRVFPDREKMLESLPKEGFVAEVGVAKGDFSAKILEISSPKELILIDAWAM